MNSHTWIVSRLPTYLGRSRPPTPQDSTIWEAWTFWEGPLFLNTFQNPARHFSSTTQTIHSCFIPVADSPIPPVCLKTPSSESIRGRIKSFLGTPFKYLRNRKGLGHPCRHHIPLGSSLCTYNIEETLPNPVDIHPLHRIHKAWTGFSAYAFILKYWDQLYSFI